MSMKNLGKRFAYGLLKLLVAIVIFNAILWLAVWLLTQPANRFCDSLAANDNSEAVKKKAEDYGYRTYDFKSDGVSVLKIPTQDSPFFRMACVVTFSNGVIISKEVIADD